MICGLVERGYGSYAEVLDMSFEQIELAWRGGKRRKGIAVRSDEDLEELDRYAAATGGVA